MKKGIAPSKDEFICNLLLFCRSQLYYTLIIHIIELSDIVSPFASLSRCRYIISLSNNFCLKALKINVFWLLTFFNWTYHQFRFIKSEVKVRHDVCYWNQISDAMLFHSEIAFTCNGNYYKWNMECGSRWPVILDKKMIYHHVSHEATLSNTSNNISW